jgi:hypothetical protein
MNLAALCGARRQPQRNAALRPQRDRRLPRTEAFAESEPRNRWRVIRISNAYTFVDPQARAKSAETAKSSSKSDFTTGTEGQDSFTSAARRLDTKNPLHECSYGSERGSKTREGAAPDGAVARSEPLKRQGDAEHDIAECGWHLLRDDLHVARPHSGVRCGVRHRTTTKDRNREVKRQRELVPIHSGGGARRRRPTISRCRHWQCHHRRWA